jgi:hypothetical protein
MKVAAFSSTTIQSTRRARSGALAMIGVDQFGIERALDYQRLAMASIAGLGDQRAEDQDAKHAMRLEAARQTPANQQKFLTASGGRSQAR